jgi:rSAM/selenodomain-associated transferase 1
MQEKLIIFVKAPRAGLVKTRLARTIGSDPACDAYRTLVDDLLAQLHSLHPVELRFAPDDSANEIKPWLTGHWSAAAQGGGPLGKRLTRAFADAFAGGWGRVVTIGSDCPEVTAGDVAQAWRALETQDVVLGPASDGGYWLVGLNAESFRSSAGIFNGIDWSTSRVLKQTLNWIKANGKSYHLLRELADVDTEEDWKGYLRERTKVATCQ